MRCDESLHGFRAGAATPGREKVEVRTPGSRESGGMNSGKTLNGMAEPVTSVRSTRP
ncbi:hypothetical protein PAXRUDRAFT_836247 [Paxillus rubicundulus Ve08.2h10]|uniref:Uncharacterized protein n=1 Tax=Paxillus rubicundulus Ve08.2h10 TaxID=930991 RepID=A0A0D0CDA0_9AGAM|nr:hypothetical protein PAXRUDRAFT_836247 [Paxillus rubicundulus Ve08.2h10]